MPRAIAEARLQPGDRGDVSAPAMHRGVHVARTEAIHGFATLIADLGGDASGMFRRLQIDPAVVDDPNGFVSYRSLARLLECAARDLACPDIGMRLANFRGGSKVVSPIDVAMRNSETVGAALQYCIDNIHVYSNAIDLAFEEVEDPSLVLLRFSIVLDRLPHQRQVVEHALTLMTLAIPMCGGVARPREAWFTHAPGLPMAAYRANFAMITRFSQAVNGLLFSRKDLKVRIPDPDRQMYELATRFIESNFPREDKPLSVRVRNLVTRHLRLSDCTQERVAAEMGLHTRTLQRRLRDEGETFEAIKDGVRRETALQYLGQPTVPLIRVAEALGYEQVSSLARRCEFWFQASPTEVRRQLRSERA